jgi:TorA maturation chaperone TorD
MQFLNNLGSSDQNAMNYDGQNHNILKAYSMLLYFAGSMVMHEPSEDCFVDFWQNGILKKLPVRSSNPNFMRAAAQLTESCQEKHLCGSSMSKDYERLFGRELLPLASPYESLYGLTPCMNTLQTPVRVTKFYDSYGWVSKFRGEVRDDHLGVELFFLTLLIEKLTELEDDACRKEMRKEIRRYLDKHVLSWVNKWNSRVQEEAGTLCYKGIGSLVVACAEDVYSLMGSPAENRTPIQDLKN